MTQVDTFTRPVPMSAAMLDDVTPAIVANLPSFLATQRWFGDKSRVITGAAATRHQVETIGDDFVILPIVHVTFETGEPVDYFVPLLVSQSPTPEGQLTTIDADHKAWSVNDAAQAASFRGWLIHQLRASDRSSSGPFQWSVTSVGRDVIDHAGDLPSRVSTAQQSNSSIVYGSAIMLKLFRRLSSGINPEIELGQFLTGETDFRNVPLLLGEWSVIASNGPPISLAVAQTFVPSISDGWSYILASLAEGSSDTDAIAGRLGQLTARMHLALESARHDPEIIPELIHEKDAAEWQAGTTRAIESTASALRSATEQYDGPTRELIDTFLAQAGQLTAQTSGYDRLVGCTKTRVHGDYHLGQTLRTTAGDFVILDFEGEPARPIEERRLRLSPLKDVAGMLRSFGYARGTAERASADDDRATLVTWERAARLAFLDRYVAESRAGGARYLPESDDDIRQAVAAWELDKALYEVTYELNNRPDWLPIPLAATLKLV